MKSFLRCLVFSGTSALAVSTANAASKPQSFDGRWVSLSCESRPQTGKDGKLETWFLKRDIKIKGLSFDAVFSNYSDANCKVPLSRFEFGGSLKIVGDFSEIPRTKMADLAVDRYMKLVPTSEGFLGFLSQATPGQCGANPWAIGKGQDIKVTGCNLMGIPPNTVTKEYELLHVRGDLLFFAARPVDGSSPSSADKRPTTLQIPLVRKR